MFLPSSYLNNNWHLKVNQHRTFLHSHQTPEQGRNISIKKSKYTGSKKYDLFVIFVTLQCFNLPSNNLEWYTEYFRLCRPKNTHMHTYKSNSSVTEFQWWILFGNIFSSVKYNNSFPIQKSWILSNRRNPIEDHKLW